MTLIRTLFVLAALLPATAFAQSWENSPENWENSPENWQNSPDNWKNSPDNWANSPDNWQNSPENWKNSPKNWENSPENHQAESVYDTSGNRIGYRVQTEGGGTIYFDNDGNRTDIYGKPLESRNAVPGAHDTNDATRLKLKLR